MNILEFRKILLKYYKQNKFQLLQVDDKIIKRAEFDLNVDAAKTDNLNLEEKIIIDFESSMRSNEISTLKINEKVLTTLFITDLHTKTTMESMKLTNIICKAFFETSILSSNESKLLKSIPIILSEVFDINNLSLNHAKNMSNFAFFKTLNKIYIDSVKSNSTQDFEAIIWSNNISTIDIIMTKNTAKLLENITLDINDLLIRAILTKVTPKNLDITCELFKTIFDIQNLKNNSGKDINLNNKQEAILKINILSEKAKNLLVQCNTLATIDLNSLRHNSEVYISFYDEGQQYISEVVKKDEYNRTIIEFCLGIN